MSSRRSLFTLHFVGQRIASRRSTFHRPLFPQRTITYTPAVRMKQRRSIEPQQVDAPLTQHATFLVVTVNENADATRTARSALASVTDVIKNVAIRDRDSLLTCIVGIGSDAWGKLTRFARPAELHPFQEVVGKKHTAISTPGDIFFHIRAERRDICFECERQLLDLFSGAVRVVDETNGFRYFDVRDLLGFVDGTANPVGCAKVPESTVVSQQDDTQAAGGSYVMVQKYIHDLAAWRALGVEQQEGIIGRTRLDNIELDDAESGQRSHKTLTTIEDESGYKYEVLRDNMPFGSPGSGQFGTYFIGYSRRLWVLERMLQRMFIGEPEGLHDRILDFSRPVTGTVFFAPSESALASLGGLP